MPNFHKLIDQFLNKLNSLNKPRIAVIGDLIIDEYFDVIVNRLSPESSTPVLLTSNSKPSMVKAGGAGNVARQIANFTDCAFFCLKQDNIEIAKPFVLRYAPVNQSPIKRRFRDEVGMHPRWDIESDNYGEYDLSSQRSDIFESFKKEFELNRFSLAVLSDYSKGIFDIDLAQRIISFCNTNDIITIVDPKSSPLEMWSGCTIIKPNRKEAEILTDTNNKFEHAKKIKARIGCKHVIITDKGYGVYGDLDLIANSDYSIKYTSGGGDIFAAILAIAHSLNFNIQEASEIAFEVGRFYVIQNNNNIVSKYDLRHYLDPIASKIVSVDELVNIKKDINKTVMVNGCFDMGLTAGHVQCLQYAKSRGDKLIVAVNSNSSIRQLKGDDRPVVSLEERMLILASLSCTDYVVSFDELTPLKLIETVKPSLLVKGGEYKKEQVVGYGVVDVEIAPLFESLSTTAKIQKIRSIN